MNGLQHRWRKVAVKQKLETLLQPRILLEKFRLFTVQLRHFTGENIARTANRVRAIALSLLQLRVLCLGFLQDRDVGVGVFPEGQKILIRSSGLGCVPGHRVGPSLAQLDQ
jgi:hypothetical protein